MGDIPVAKPAPKPRWRYTRRVLVVACVLAALGTMLFVGLTAAYPVGTKVDGGARWTNVASLGELQTNVPTRVVTADYKLWVVRLGTGEVLALSTRDPYPRGCSVSWRPDMLFDGHKGWFRELCIGSTYALNGVKVFGPSPRGMDRYETRIQGDNVQILFGRNTLIQGSGQLAPYIPRR